jgi:hypothetical protein
MSDIKEKVSITAKVGVVNIDDTEAINDSLQQQILSSCGALKSRGVTSAKVTIKFDASFES